jgi:hypothetical protein
MRDGWRRFWLGFGAAGFLGGLMLWALSPGISLRHMGLILAIAAPITTFWRVMKPRLAPHCPRPPEPGTPQ